VSTIDINAFTANLGSTTNYWLDFDSDGIVGVTDRNMMLWHFNHRCNFPNNP
jgi:hypothetical protein